ncbi:MULTISPECIES: DUF3168 domain-containing protein [Rhodomicrobium]|uniref:DUF3168 domain-containing protein n=1 Tax=Rhodomicrobium TaxID=1068 RepID=UPI000B4C0A0A|nr:MULTISPECIES: DUF3168 domain-containing protein [Rhodomicrobium]
MTNPGWDLQKTVYTALAADAQLTALIDTGLYDHVPQNAAFPFVVIDQMQLRDWSTGTERGSEHVLMLHVWSRQEGKREAYAIADAVREVLDGAELTLDDNRLVNLAHQFSDLKRDPDGETYHGVLRFRAMTAPLI